MKLSSKLNHAGRLLGISCTFVVGILSIIASTSTQPTNRSSSSSLPSIPNHYFVANYDIVVATVEDPPIGKKKFGATKCTSKHCANNLFSIEWVPTGEQVGFVYSNNIDQSVKLVWDDTVFIDEGGVNHKVIHAGVKLIDRNASQPPTLIARRGKIEDLVYPADNVHWREGYYGRYISSAGGWDQKPIFPNYQYGGSREKLIAEANAQVGKTVEVLLLIQVDEQRYEYLFRFKVNGVDVTEKKN